MKPTELSQEAKAAITALGGKRLSDPSDEGYYFFPHLSTSMPNLDLMKIEPPGKEVSDGGFEACYIYDNPERSEGPLAGTLEFRTRTPSGLHENAPAGPSISALFIKNSLATSSTVHFYPPDAATNRPASLVFTAMGQTPQIFNIIPGGVPYRKNYQKEDRAGVAANLAGKGLEFFMKAVPSLNPRAFPFSVIPELNKLLEDGQVWLAKHKGKNAEPQRHLAQAPAPAVAPQKTGSLGATPRPGH